MSVKLMSMVFERFPVGGNERLLALALADHADDEGKRVHPGFERLAKKVMVSERTIIRLIKKLTEMGWLIKVSKGSAIRGVANEYCINPDWIKGDKLSPQTEPVGVTNETVGVTQRVNWGDTAMSHQHQQPSIQHQTIPRAHEADEGGGASVTPEGRLACRLIRLGVGVTSMNPVLLAWIADKVPDALIDQCVALARQRKPLPERIAARYLDAIIRSELKPKADLSWLMDDNATIAKGAELGLEAKVGESMRDYRTRLKAHVQGSAVAHV